MQLFELTSRRFERKYQIEDFSSSLVEQYVRLHPAGFRRLFPDRVVNNIYFDTPGFLTFHQNVAGVNERNKFRLRWYGDDFQQIKNAIFEVKMKHNELGSKRLYKLGDLAWETVPLVHERIQGWSPTFAALRASLFNSYRRSYFGTSSGDFRITIDQNMRFAAPFSRQTNPHFTAAAEQVVLEIKYEEALDAKSDFIFQNLPFRATKSSKYVNGIRKILVEN